MSMQQDGGAESYIEPGGNNIMLVYILYLVSFITGGLASIVGVVFAYLNLGKGAAWADTHYTYQIRTFWLGILYSLICMVLAIIAIGFLLMFLVAVWVIVRCIKGLQAASRREPIADPQTWLV